MSPVDTDENSSKAFAKFSARLYARFRFMLMNTVWNSDVASQYSFIAVWIVGDVTAPTDADKPGLEGTVRLPAIVSAIETGGIIEAGALSELEKLASECIAPLVEDSERERYPGWMDEVEGMEPASLQS